MAQGHIIALAGAPILDSEGLRVIAHWSQDLRGPSFESAFEWKVRSKVGDMPLSHGTAPAGDAVDAMRQRVNRVYANGPVQVWQMAWAVAPDDLERVIGSGPFTLASTSDPDDLRRVHGAARALLNATRLRLSPQTRDELEFLAQRASHQIEARKW